MGKNQFKELENVLLDQIEKLSDDSLFEDEQKARIVIEKSRAISDLSENFTTLQQTKLAIAKEISKDIVYNDVQLKGFLGIE